MRGTFLLLLFLGGAAFLPPPLGDAVSLPAFRERRDAARTLVLLVLGWHFFIIGILCFVAGVFCFFGVVIVCDFCGDLFFGGGASFPKRNAFK